MSTDNSRASISLSKFGNLPVKQGFDGTNGSTTNGNVKKTGLNIIFPIIKEKVLSESIQLRTDILPELRELGPPDLVHLSRYNKKTSKEIGEYHYVTGIDVSSLSAPLMYLKTIQLNTNELNNVSKKTPPKSTHPSIATYCVYNCFSKGDLRIRYQFPGTPQPIVQFFPSNSKKNMINIENSKSELWIESYVSGIIRSILFGDDISRQLPGMCKFNPFTSTNSAKEAVRLLVKYIPKGVLVGCSDLINQPSLICNNLVDSLIELLKITELYELAINCIYELEEFNQNEQYQILIVKILILQGEQLKAVRIMYDYLKSYPRDGLMLNEQAKYLLSKNRSDLALIPSKRAVESLPGEFECWSTLVECYIMLKDYSNALLSLNSCPMYSTKKKDIFKAIKPGDFSFPFPSEGSYSKIWQDAEDIGCMSGLGGIVEFSPLVQVENVNPIYLQVYNSVKLHSTFKKAYDFLSIIARQKGWSELLRLRSNVFVMEDEYHSLILNEQKQEQKEHLEYLKSSSQLQLNQQQTGSSNNTSNTSNTNHLTVDSINGSNADFNNGNGNVYDSTTTSNIENGGEFIRGRSSSLSFVKKRRNSSQVSKFRSKRLSERWLDSLFLIFYEELRSVLMYEMEKNSSNSNGGGNGRRRSERSGDSVENDGNGAVSQEVTQHIALEWELIGAACFRAHHYDSGIEAYKTCLEGRFSLFASTQLLKYYLNLKESPVEFIRLNPSVVNRPNSFIKNDYILNLLVKHLAWNYRWYGEFSVLSIKVLKILLEEEGGSFIQTTIGVIFENEGITSVVDKLINWIEQFDNNV